MHEHTMGKVIVPSNVFDILVAALRQIDYEDDGPSGEIAANALKEVGIDRLEGDRNA